MVDKSNTTKNKKNVNFKRKKNEDENEKLDEESTEEYSENSTEKSLRPQIKKYKAVEELLFKLPLVDFPIEGTPQEVQKQLDKIAQNIQKDPNSIENQRNFDRIHLYMHGYLLHVVLKQFPYIKGYETVDIYQEALIAMRFKAIPNFKEGRGMSFLNFAKMCIKRHLITILNASHNRLKDQSINRSVSLDSSPLNEEGSSNYSNILPDPAASADEEAEKNESFSITLKTLNNELSEFEQQVLKAWLSSNSYNEIAELLTQQNKEQGKNKKCGAKAVDNALLRIRRKASYLVEHSKDDDLPLFMK